MENMEIEKKFMVKKLPDLEKYDRHIITQAYLCTDPTVRIRRQDDDYYMTYKGKGLLAHEEYNLPLTKEGYEHLLTKADGYVISKTRYLIPIKNNLTVELDVFDKPFAPLIMAEVEFPDMETANAYQPESWLGVEVTGRKEFSNSNMSKTGQCPTV